MINNLSEPLRTQVNSFISSGNSAGGTTSVSTGISKVYFEKNQAEYIISTRVIDFIGGVIGFIITLPLFIITTLAVGITSGFPILFKQERLGRNGKRVSVRKFRTMRKDAEDILQEDEGLYQRYIENDYKLPDGEDPRITRLGRFLRRTSLDEIPQFINVIKGEMSLVGPRPIVPDEIDRYGNHSGEFLSVKPGMTGLWQVSGRSDVGYPDRTYLDLIYIRTKTPILDFKILFKTMWIVVKRAGAH